MDSKEALSALRKEIDDVDGELIALFQKRMGLSEQIADVKAGGNMAIVDEKREESVLAAAAARAGGQDTAAVTAFMRTLMALSKIKQNQRLVAADPLSFPEPAPKKEGPVNVAFQGVPGAWSEHGAEQLFPNGKRQQYDYFEDVFEAVKAGRADYGVLPIENSRTGAIGEVYDLLRKYACYIVGEVWITVAQCLLACEGTKLTDIREVFSHPEAFNQCRRFLKNKPWDLTASRNTAYAAQLVAEQQNPKYATISSRRAAEIHGLTVLAADIMDWPDNRTRFIAIAADPIYDETCDTTSITFSTAHKSGALCAVLQSFMLAGINLSRIESRPVSADRYRFFADLQANILSDSTMDALQQAATQCNYFELLGCYPRGSNQS